MPLMNGTYVVFALFFSFVKPGAAATQPARTHGINSKQLACVHT